MVGRVRSAGSNSFGSALVYAILGTLLGNVMGARGDHSQMPTRAHHMPIGWISFALFGFFYHLFAERAATLLARLHFWLAKMTYLALPVVRGARWAYVADGVA